MAAFMRHHVLSKVAFNRRFSSKSWRPVSGRKISSTKDKISAKGFMRPLKGYFPPDNANEKINQICTQVFGSDKLDIKMKLNDPNVRFSIFSECYKEFHHGIPNSLLNTILTLEDLQTFYMTPVETTVPYDAMKNMELPPNLHIQYEPIRFHPDTDTLFGGQTAFPRSSTIVSGIYTRKKYKSYIVDDAEP